MILAENEEIRMLSTRILIGVNSMQQILASSPYNNHKHHQKTSDDA